MKDFNDIYNSLDSNFAPQPRSIFDLGIIMSKLYEILKSDKYFDFNPFDLKDSPNDTDRTTIERLILELTETEAEKNEIPTVTSEGIERVISDIKILETNSINQETTSSNSIMFDFSHLKGQLLFLIDISRSGLFLMKKQKILNSIKTLNDKNSKLNYLNSTLLEIKQNKDFWDDIQYAHIVNFIELEISKWEKFIENRDKIFFSSNQKLHNYIVKLINEKLIHNIKYLEGYKVFWRDESSSKEPKKETEIQHFIKSILKPYCEENQIKIHRESVIANGQIDMTFTYLNHSVCLEIKKAQHPNILTSINSQLSEYMIGEETDYGIYLILWYKTSDGYEFPKKFNSIEDLIGKIEVENDNLKYEIIGVDCTNPISPSKR